MTDTDLQELLGGGVGDPFKVIQKLFNSDEIEFITDLNIKEIHSIAIILFLADYVGLPEYEQFIKAIMKLKVSKDRKGREEFLALFKSIKEAEDKKPELPFVK